MSAVCLRRSLLLLVALVTTACDKEEPVAPKQSVKEVILNVRTVDKTTAPVEMVRFYINGKKFGITDQDGTFKGRYPAKDGELLTFNVEAPPGYSVPANIDQSQWRHKVKYPASGRPLQLDFTATLQRPERDYLFMVRTKTPASPVTVNAKNVGKTGSNGDVLLMVRGEPGAKFAARAGQAIFNGVFAEEEEVYLLTEAKQGPVGGAPVEVAAAPATVEAAPDTVAAPESLAAIEPPQPVAPETEAPPPVDIAPETAAPRPAPVAPRTEAAVARRAPPPDDLFAVEPAPRDPPPRDPPPRVERRQPDPPPVAYEDPPPLDVVPEPPPAARVVEADPPPVDDGLEGLLDDPGGIEVPEAPPVAALETGSPALVADVAPEPAPGKIRGRGARARAEAKLGDGLIDDDGQDVKADAIRAKPTVGGAAGPSVTSMSREEISSKLSQIRSGMGSSKVLKRTDVDFLSQIDRTHPGYYEANRLLASFYYGLKDYKRQTQALEVATSRGKYKHDPTVLLSLAKAYARAKRYRKALSTMRRVESKMRRLPAARKADAYRFYAEILEFEFLRQFSDDPKGANVSLVDKAVSKWERYRTFNRGADPGGVAKANKKIKELSDLKQRVEL